MAFILIVIAALQPSQSFAEAKQEKKKVERSALTAELSKNPFALTIADNIPVKKTREEFGFDDRKIIWSASIRNGLGAYNRKDYLVCWYGPDGMIFSKQEPKFFYFDCSGLRSELLVDKLSMGDKCGVWKMEVIFNNQIIDEKYFYLGESRGAGVSDEEKKNIDSILSRDVQASMDIEEAKNFSRKELASCIFKDNIDPNLSAGVREIYLTADKNDRPAINFNGKVYIPRDFKELVWVGIFKTFWGVGKNNLEVYWLDPDKKIVQQNNAQMIVCDRADFRLKRETLDGVPDGEWAVICYAENKKISQNNFIIAGDEEYSRILADEEKRVSIKRLENGSEKNKKRPAVEPLKGGKPKPKIYWDVKKGADKAEISEKWADPDRVIVIDPEHEVWVYWTVLSHDAYSSSRAGGIASGGNILGALLYSAISASVDTAFQSGSILVLYYEQGKVRDVAVKQSVYLEEVDKITLNELKTLIKDIPVKQG
ncbi:MAG: hypothetical protein HQL30_00380 [Candidatus Omnitrophica bacterium]|nr:hypothetical protein [Candidatus Omnitrophota bacterium]